MNQHSQNLQHSAGGGNDESTAREALHGGVPAMTPREALDRAIITVDGILKNDRKQIPQHVYDLLSQLKETCASAFHNSGVAATAGKSG